MKNAIAAALGLALSAVLAGSAFGGDWEWGCIGPMGDEQILFSRMSLIIAPAKPPLGKLEDLFRIDDLSGKFPDAEGYNPDQTNDGLTKRMTYTSQDNSKNILTLTERSSKNLSHTFHIVCGRDESTSITRKIYHVERSNEAATNVTLVCHEYLLTSRGGRPCFYK